MSVDLDERRIFKKKNEIITLRCLESFRRLGDVPACERLVRLAQRMQTALFTPPLTHYIPSQLEHQFPANNNTTHPREKSQWQRERALRKRARKWASMSPEARQIFERDPTRVWAG